MFNLVPLSLIWSGKLIDILSYYDTLCDARAFFHILCKVQDKRTCLDGIQKFNRWLAGVFTSAPLGGLVYGIGSIPLKPLKSTTAKDFSGKFQRGCGTDVSVKADKTVRTCQTATT